jgi:hypothetical protein
MGDASSQNAGSWGQFLLLWLLFAMMWPAVFAILSLSFINLRPTSAWHIPKYGAEAWSKLHIKSFVAFGDSYTDEGRLGYFINNNGSAPPTGTLLPAVSLHALP